MITAVAVLTLLGLALGLMLGYADKVFAVEENPIVKEVESMLPGTHCGQCGFTGCGGAAEAMVNGEAQVTCCPPGGRSLAQALAEKLGVSVDLSGMASEAMIAAIDESLCTGCCRCYRVCPTDAILGANKQIHAVFADACTGCEKCLDACPEDCIAMRPEQETLDTWHWPKPAAA
ncbi:Electron transport complex protein RnfB [Marinobacterium lacunae]|uniref:Ion-translocating oxidoreductase complex subunit B n=1 Tax=Marinobacterium lacunae TaxID=1232683 RepID=A0A081FWS3_9GAMM|nr:RnfABCDGE type electron transport complex subunit B [Marinobacterium lacunae]KEA62978.1 Electron transport complex protein RnfB [Marinobacterium lacunae]MBR9884155.1 RnfABCDGE type electron transport complex subunit B [Oceanospirillales bacterium]